jgi:RNA polymerase sigma factor (sigma-70 family)
MTAEELMVMYQQNSPENAYRAFEELYSRFSQKIFSFALRKVQNAADAEDLLQKIFLKIHDSKHLYKTKYKFEQWIFVIAKTTLLDHFRSQTRYANRLQKLELEMDNEFDNNHWDLKLEAPQKELLEMKFIDDLSYKEMGALLNKSETSLRKTVSRLVKKLKEGDV